MESQMQTNELVRHEPTGSGSETTVHVPIPSRTDAPHVEVLKDAEIVTSIRISCSCGCTVDINCQYE